MIRTCETPARPLALQADEARTHTLKTGCTHARTITHAALSVAPHLLSLPHTAHSETDKTDKTDTPPTLHTFLTESFAQHPKCCLPLHIVVAAVSTTTATTSPRRRQGSGHLTQELQRMLPTLIRPLHAALPRLVPLRPRGIPHRPTTQRRHALELPRLAAVESLLFARISAFPQRIVAR